MPRHHLGVSALIAAAGIVFALWPAAASAENELERHFKDEYKGKTLVLRGFYSGNYLEYDAGGSLLSPSSPDDWTLSGVVQVDDLRVSGGRLKITATRLHLGWPDGRFQEMHDHVSKPARDEKEDRSLRIEADLTAETADSLDKVLSKIFLTPHDRLADLVPDYWRPCMLAALTGEDSKRYGKCSFSPDFAAIPGVSATTEENTESDEITAGQSPAPSFHSGNGVDPPKLISRNEPEFSEGARRARYQGSAVLSMVVDKNGQPKSIQIIQPLGMGLDRKAVDAVSKWRFDPGTKDGEPVGVEMAVEVDFHLY